MERHGAEAGYKPEAEKKPEKSVGVSKVLRAAALAGLLGVLEACGGDIPREAANQVPRVELEYILENPDKLPNTVIRTEGRLRSIGDKTFTRSVWRPTMKMDGGTAMEFVEESVTLPFFRLSTPFEHSMLAAKMPEAPLYTDQSMYEVAGVVERHEISGEQGGPKSIFFITGVRGEAESSAPTNR